MASPISWRSVLDLERMVSSRSSVSLVFKEGFDIAGVVVELAFFTGFFDLAMGSIFEMFQFRCRRAVFTNRIVRGLDLNRPEGDDFAVHNNTNVIPLDRPAQQVGKIATSGGWRESEHAHDGNLSHFRRLCEQIFKVPNLYHGTEK
jgi:hypothetical protein